MKNIPVIIPAQAATLIRDGDTLLVGGFGMTGSPVRVLEALAETNVTNLTFVGNNIGEPGIGGGRLLPKKQVKKVVGSYFTSNPELIAAVQTGEIQADLTPQGSLAEAIRAGGAGLGGFFTPAGAGTQLAQAKETREIDGKQMVYVPPIRGDVALVRAYRADASGNLQYRMTENNFNQAIATAAKTVIAEVQEIVEVGELRPEEIHTPGCFVDYLVRAELTSKDLGTSASVAKSDKRVDSRRSTMAQLALEMLPAGSVVNLGIGIPTLIADWIKPEHNIVLQSENGMLGVGPEPAEGGALDYPVNAGKIPVTAMKGASYFDSAASFAMIRGGHIDVAIMGGLQVDQHGNLANWSIPGKPLLGVGGAMDVATGAKRLIIMMTHTDRAGGSKVVSQCTLPLTAERAVDVLITDLAVFEFQNDVMTLTRLLPGATLDQVKAKTNAKFEVSITPVE